MTAQMQTEMVNTIRSWWPIPNPMIGIGVMESLLPVNGKVEQLHHVVGRHGVVLPKHHCSKKTGFIRQTNEIKLPLKI